MIAEGTIEEVGPRVQARGAQVLDVKGLVVCPGFIDIHTHLREPGREDKETIATGTRAAAAGGFTAVCAMPNTDPVNDTAGITRAIVEQGPRGGRGAGLPDRRHHPGPEGRGARGVRRPEGGRLRRVLRRRQAGGERPRHAPRPRVREGLRPRVIDHCEEPTLAERACMNEGPVSTLLGLRGQPAAGEAIMVERDVLLAELTGGRVHIAHLSAAASVDAVRRGKARGVRVTAEVTPHHLFLTDEAVRETGYDTNTKMNPPAALRGGPRGGARGAARRHDRLHRHRPRARTPWTTRRSSTTRRRTASWAWRRRWRSASTGWSGPGSLELPHLVALLSANPARVLGLPGGTLAPGSPADLTRPRPREEAPGGPDALREPRAATRRSAAGS